MTQSKLKRKKDFSFTLNVSVIQAFFVPNASLVPVVFIVSCQLFRSLRKNNFHFNFGFDIDLYTVDPTRFKILISYKQDMLNRD